MQVRNPYCYKLYQYHSLLFLTLGRTWTVVVVLHHAPSDPLKSIWIVTRGEENLTKADDKLTLERILKFVRTEKKNVKKMLWIEGLKKMATKIFKVIFQIVRSVLFSLTFPPHSVCLIVS